MNKGLTCKTGQTHVQRYTKPLLARIRTGEIDPSFVITHRVNLEEAPAAYKKFRDKEDGCIKVVLKPQLGWQCKDNNYQWQLERNLRMKHTN